MSEYDPTTLNLADFDLGHETDPLQVSDEFRRWRASAPQYHALFSRPLATGAAPRTTLHVDGRDYDVINMASLDYLGLCGHPAVSRAQMNAFETWGNGAAGTPLVSGTTTLHKQLEQDVCAMTGKASCLLYTSGFSAATGLMVALLRRGDVAVLDQFAHLSWHDGAHMSRARVATFAHNDPESLDAVLSRHATRRRIVIVDGLYSMDGDFAQLRALLDVCDAHDVGLVVDEAHSVFADGPRGDGVTGRLGEMGRVRAFMGTFSKSLSVVGGFVCVDQDLGDYLRYFSHPYGFSAALPPATVAGLTKAVELARHGTERRQTLAARALRFRDGLKTLGLNIGVSQSWIVPVIVGADREFLLSATQELMQKGLYVAPIEFPAVPEDGLRMRCAVSAGHSEADIDEALNLLESVVARPLKIRRGT